MAGESPEDADEPGESSSGMVLDRLKGAVSLGGGKNGRTIPAKVQEASDFQKYVQ